MSPVGTSVLEPPTERPRTTAHPTLAPEQRTKPEPTPGAIPPIPAGPIPVGSVRSQPPPLSPFTAPSPPTSTADLMALHAAYGNAAVARAATIGEISTPPKPPVSSTAPAAPVPSSVPATVPGSALGERAAAEKLPMAAASSSPARAAPLGATSGAAVTAGPQAEIKVSPGAAPPAEPGAAGGKPAVASPEKDPAFQAVVHHVKAVAKHQAAHAPASAKAAEAHAAAVSPPNEVSSRAAAKQVNEIDQQTPKPFNRAAFKAALLKKIAEAAPKTLGQAADFKKNGKLEGVKGDLTSKVADEKKESQGAIPEKVAQTPDASGIEPKPTTPLPAVQVGPAPEVTASGAAPKPVSDSAVSLKEGPRELDKRMADASVTDDQLQHSNEPAFQAALGQKKEAEKESVQAPQEYRKQEARMLASAQADAHSVVAKDVAEMHSARKHALTGVQGQQTHSETEEEKERAKISSDIEAIYQKAKKSVEDRLKKLDDDVNKTFDDGATAAQKDFEDYVDSRMTDYKLKRYLLTPGGSVLWLKDELLGMPDEVNAFYQEGHDRYVALMDAVIDHVAETVETGLNESKGIVAAGKQEIQAYVQGLPAALRDVGKKAAAGIQSKFDALDQTITSKQDQLVESLAKKYNDNLAKVNARIDEMKAANKGLVDAAKQALNGVIQTIIDLKNMLLNVLSRAAGAIGMIIDKPIDFLGHLVDAGKQGFMNFVDHIGEHLKQGFMQWLFGAVAEIGIQLPQHFDLPGILSLVLQVLGLTYANIRARAVKILGEKIVKALETAWEIFKILITKGPGGLWEYIKEKIGDLKTMVIEKIKSFVMEKIIVAGITWLIGLLNPASAFVKACKAIYDIVMFFVERGKQILDLVNAIIDSITAIAKGAIGAAAAFVENSLARTIPVVIGFLASLLGVGGISEKIKEIIDAIRAPVNAAIDWVINKAVDIVKAIGGLLGFGKGEGGKVEPAKELGGVQAAAQTAVHEKLGSDATVEKAESVLPQILRELQPMGLKSLTLGPADADGSREILAEASPRKRVAELAHKKITVAISATIRVEGEPVLSGLLYGQRAERAPSGAETLWPPETLQFAEFHEAQKESLGGTGSAAVLPPVPQPPGTPAKKGSQPSGGLIVEPEAASRELEILAWNTSQPKRGHNVSHAERQFIEWFEGRPMRWLNRVVSVHIDVEGRPVCEQCLKDLNGLRERFRWIDFSWTGAPKKEAEELEVV